MRSSLLRIVLTLLAMALLFSGACAEGTVNQAPIITSLSGEPESLAIGGTTTITCVASDADGDYLSYTWSTTGGSVSGTGSIINWTAPDTGGAYSISVTVADDKGGTVDGSLSITVVAEGTNSPPVITSLSVDLKSVEPEKKAIVTCEASDPDGDPLTYSWWAELGRFEGTGNVVTYVAPIYTGDYKIEVHVRDNRGGNAVKSYTVNVANNEPPEIDRVRADPQVVVTDYSSTITCTADDPDGDSLTYTWSANGGTISGSGNVITWTAPGRAGYFTIEVTVDDQRGGTDTLDTTVQVEGLKTAPVLEPVTRESGAVRSDGSVISLWTVGDDSLNNAVRTYLSFDLTSISRVKEFRSAELSVSTLVKNGTPWADLGDFFIDEVDYGSRPLDDGDYDLPGKRLERFASEPLTAMDLTELIKRAISDDESRFQIKIYFQNETDKDGSPDNLRVTSAELKIYYVEETQ